jgi:hypothetical protein
MARKRRRNLARGSVPGLIERLIERLHPAQVFALAFLIVVALFVLRLYGRI